jgi:N-acetylmuramic acid 6-phosphate etherase
MQDRLCGFMTGGDYAFIRSVESFEDYETFGAQQVRDNGLGSGDLVIGISEGGETSSVIGSVLEGLRHGADAAFICNNPHEILRQRLARCRRLLDDPRVLALDLTSGPMAVAGSTRMQATTGEMLIVGAAIELALSRAAGRLGLELPDTALPVGGDAMEYARRFRELLADLETDRNVAAMAGWAAMEAETYRRGNVLTYYGDLALVDILTDTTERTPTFGLPPFLRRSSDSSIRPMAFVKHPCLSTEQTWLGILQRPPRCLTWTSETYRQLGAEARIVGNPPEISLADLMEFEIGDEPAPSRWRSAGDTAMLVGCDADFSEDRTFELPDAFRHAAASFPKHAACLVVPPETAAAIPDCDAAWQISYTAQQTPLRLFDHLALKLVFNTVSTASMALLGRIHGNWMTYVLPTNKKLIDRGTRIIAGLTGLGYREACRELYREMSDRGNLAERPSPVHAALDRILAGERNARSGPMHTS